jgi:hypothetical protein
MKISQYENTITFATKYVERQGWSCIPIPYKQKQARIPWKEFQNRRPTPKELWQWFAYNRSNIAIITGDVSTRLLVIDFDDPRLFVAWYEQTLIESLSVVSGKGIHVYFRLAADDEPPLNGKFCVNGQVAGDVRYNGGYVLAPPSVHPNGQVYAWMNTGRMMMLRFDDLNLTRPAHKNTAKKQADRRVRQEHGVGAFPGIPASVKHPKAYAKAGLDREIQNILSATPGEDRNIKLFNAAWKLRRYAALLGGESVIEQTLIDVGQRVGLPLSEVHRTIRSAFSY